MSAAQTTPSPPRRVRYLTRLRRADTYGLLFFLLLLDVALVINSSDSGWTRALSSAFTGFTLVLAVRTSRARRLYVLLGWVGLVLMVAAGVLGAILKNKEFPSLVYLLITFELALTIPVIVSRLTTHRTVTVETVTGALCIYMLAGMVLASLLSALSLLSGHEYLVATAAAHGPITRGDYYYFSFVTMTTTGFGDLIAANSAGRSLAILLAILGQVYLVTTVAWLVSMARPMRVRAEAEAGPPQEEEPRRSGAPLGGERRIRGPVGERPV